jgi:uncharacterized protein YcnI
MKHFLALALLSIGIMSPASTKVDNTLTLSITDPNGLTTISGGGTTDVKITGPSGILIEAAQPVPIVVVGLTKSKALTATITITDPNHKCTVTGNNTTHVTITGPSGISIEAAQPIPIVVVG